MKSEPDSAPSGSAPYRLLLASASAYRRELLGRLGVGFEVLAPQIDETPLPGEPADALAARLARGKALEAYRQRPGAAVIGSDQAAACEERILGKPQTRERSIEQLSLSSGKWAVFYTAVAIAAADGRTVHEHLDVTRARFRHLTRVEIAAYVDRESALDCAGGFKSEGLGIALFERIESQDPTALIGLPLIAVARMLRQAGFKIP